MAEIFGYPIMGGGSDLNFKVIAVASESALPSTAAENTIAVITTTPISEWEMSVVTSPTWSGAPEGFVYITIRASYLGDGIGFNAIKRNGLWVYPTGCQQYVSGAWASKVAKIYQNGTWADWRLVVKQLYWNGDKCENVTGGWDYVSDGGTVSFGTDSLYMAAPQGKYPKVYTVNEIALAAESYNTLCIDCVVSLSGGNFLEVTDTSGTSLGKAYIGTTSRGVTKLDVSSIEKGIVKYVCVNTRTTTVYRIWAE